MTRLTEHHRFYFADFKREAEWLRKKSNEGMRLVDTDGATYEFEKGVKEDWIYQTDDFKKGDDPDTFLDKYQAKGWRFVCRANDRVYFRKRNMGEIDYSVFSDDETRMAYSKYMVRRQALKMLPAYIAMLVYLWFLLFTPLMKEVNQVAYAILISLGFLFIIIFSFGVGMHMSENKRWKTVNKEMKQPKETKEISLEEAIEKMEDSNK